jgi:hypothetical protein
VSTHSSVASSCWCAPGAVPATQRVRSPRDSLLNISSAATIRRSHTSDSVIQNAAWADIEMKWKRAGRPARP